MRTLTRDDRSSGSGKSVADSYRRLVRETRRTQLQATETNVRRIERVFDVAVQSLARKVRDAEADSLAQGYYGALLSDLDARLAALRQDYAVVLQAGMVEMAQAAAEREAATAELAGANVDRGLRPDMTKSLLLSDGTQVGVSFGQVAAGAVERAASRVYSDGWKLSDRLYNLDQLARQTVQETLVQGVTEQISARALAHRLEGALAAAGSENPRYHAMRIARTEIVTAHREAHILSTLASDGKLKPYLAGIGWRLSLSHPRPDVCDIWANDDGDGLGAGNYLPENVPSDHPHGLCYTISVLAEHPDVSAPSKEAQADDVTESQVRYYAETYDDPAARRWLEKRNEETLL